MADSAVSHRVDASRAQHHRLSVCMEKISCSDNYNCLSLFEDTLRQIVICRCHESGVEAACEIAEQPRRVKCRTRRGSHAIGEAETQEQQAHEDVVIREVAHEEESSVWLVSGRDTRRVHRHTRCGSLALSENFVHLVHVIRADDHRRTIVETQNVRLCEKQATRL